MDYRDSPALRLVALAGPRRPGNDELKMAAGP